MNKDLDERLITKGEYRDAMNIQVSTSEGSSVGAVQNILGNSLVAGQDFITANSTCVGSVADEKNDKLYYFVAGAIDSIVEYDSKTKVLTPVLVDPQGDVLRLNSNNAITGINVIDDLLLWTDNTSEPKKINITRCKAGTDSSGVIRTNLMVNGVNEGVIKEEHITVIRKGPSMAPKIIPISSKRSGHVEGPVRSANLFYPDGNGNDEVNEGHEMWIGIQNFNSSTNGGIGVGDRPNLLAGDIIRVYRGNTTPVLGEKPVARLLIKDVESGPFYYSQAQNDFDVIDDTTGVGIIADSSQTAFKVAVSTLVTHTSTSNYWFELEQEEDSIFERKLPRFACRYKYEDNEYSPVGPFSEVVFIPGEFDYHPTEAYNKGMINNLKELNLESFIPTDIPSDVVGVDLLYKNEFSPNIYVIKSIEKDDEFWSGGFTHPLKPKGSYTITTDNVYAQVPSSQLIRPWDNVPKKALAQEVTGNRVVYGNYVQGYDFTKADGSKVAPKLSANLDNRFNNNSTNKTRKSIKSQRTYNFGILYGDEYGRETPIFTNDSANELITKSSSASSNSISINIENDPPSWADYYKIFVKETSNEYYNLAMGRAYDAEDSNVWISFPSIDRNKVDEDTYLVLKKGAEDLGAVLDKARYKVVAIENEAPDHIKTKYTVLAEPNMDINGYSLIGGTSLTNVEFPSPIQPPYPGQSTFTIRKHTWSDPYDVASHRFGLIDLVEMWEDRKDTEIYVSFSNKFKGTSTAAWKDIPLRMSKKYKVMEITTPDVSGVEYSNGTNIPGIYLIKLNESISQDDAFVTDTASVNFAFGGQFKPHFYKKEVENSPEFDGRFFVKIIEDSILAEYLPREVAPTNQGWNVDTSINELYYLSDTGGYLFGDGVHGAGTTGNSASITPAHWHTNLGGSSSSRWFIDATSFAGLQPANSAHVYDFVAVQDTVQLSDIDSDINYAVATGDYNTNAPGDSVTLSIADNTLGSASDESWGDGRSKGAAFLRGAHDGAYIQNQLGDVTTSAEATPFSGEKFLHLSYGGISPVGEGPNFKQTVNPNTHGVWDIAWWLAFDFTKNWNVGKDGGENTYTDDQEHIVEKLTYGSLFRLKDDPNVYKITMATKRRLYNYRGANRCEDGLQYYSQAYTDPSLGNTLDASNIVSSVQTANAAITATGGISGFDDTSVLGQFRHMTHPSNCRMSYLIKYEVLDGTQNHDLDWGTSSTAPTGEDLLNSTAFSMDGLIINESTSGVLEFVSTFTTNKENLLPDNPAIFETEPKEDVGLDIYYEATGKKPLNKNQSNILNLVQIGAILSVDPQSTTAGVMDGTFVTGVQDVGLGSFKVVLSNQVSLDELGFINGVTDSSNNTRLKFHNDDGSFAVARLIPFTYDGTGSSSAAANVNGPDGVSTQSFSSIPTEVQTVYVEFIDDVIGLGWWNCWSFGNGVESNRIGDTYNKPFVANGVKASTTLLEAYGEEHRKHGLIYSGIYNSTGGVNNLNQFIAAEKITKDINPIYGSIQKLHSRSTADGDLIALCEDRVLKILANKDALYNADGNPQLVSTNNVLGQAVPFSGEFGISKNPESFASESYRVYFTDKTRGAVIRLSKDGLTAISDHGMKDWFRDNLKLSNKLIGSYDDRKDEYNITLGEIGAPSYTTTTTQTTSAFEWQGWADINSSATVLNISAMSGVMVGDVVAVSASSFSFSVAAGTVVTSTSVIGNSMTVTLDNAVTRTAETNNPMYPWSVNFIFTGTRTTNNTTTSLDSTAGYPSKTVSFKEDVRGWVSFKSFTPENAISCANEYYTFNNGLLWKHHDESEDRNTFYKGYPSSGFTPSSINVILNDQPGTVKTFHTLNYEGSQSKVDSFTNYYTYLPGTTIPNNNGILYNNEYYNISSKPGWKVQHIQTDLEEGSLNEFIKKEGKWFNHIKGKAGSVVDVADATSIISGFDNADFSFQGIGTIIAAPDISNVYGCTANGLDVNAAGNVNDQFGDGEAAFNYNPQAMIDDGGCVQTIFGCTASGGGGYDPLANTDDFSCVYYGCDNIYAPNYDPNVGHPVTPPGAYIFQNDGSCTTPIYGCMWQELDVHGNLVMLNYNSLANTPCNASLVPGGSQPCATPPFNAPSYTTLGDNCCCVPYIYGCMDSGADNFDSTANTQETSSVDPTNPCNTNIYGCPDSSACNYYGTVLANQTLVDDFSCAYCNDPLANNYDGTAPDGDPYGCANNNACEACKDITNLQQVLGGGNLDTTIDVSWDETWSGNAPVDHYELRYSSDSGVTYNYITPIYPNVSQGTVYHSISGLTANTAYTIEVKAVCSAGTSILNPLHNTESGWGLILSVTTFETQVYGCTDANACNYYGSPQAGEILVDNETCEYSSCAGCTDPLAENTTYFVDGDGNTVIATIQTFTPSGLTTCQYINGCTDVTAFNYDALATFDDGSCVAVTVGCLDDSLNNSGSTYAATNYAGPGNTLGNDPATGLPYPVANTVCNDNGMNNDCCQYIMPTFHNAQIDTDWGGSAVLNTNGWGSTGLWGTPGPNFARKVFAFWDVSLSPKIILTNASGSPRTLFAYENENGNSGPPHGDITSFGIPSSWKYKLSTSSSLTHGLPINTSFNSENGIDNLELISFEKTVHSGKVYFGAHPEWYPPQNGAGAHQQVPKFEFWENHIAAYTPPTETYNVTLGCNDATAANYVTEIPFFDNSLCVYNTGCTDSTACNYDATAAVNDGSCEYCGDDQQNADGEYMATNYDDASCNTGCVYCQTAWGAITTTNIATLGYGTIQWTVPFTSTINNQFAAPIIEYQWFLLDAAGNEIGDDIITTGISPGATITHPFSYLLHPTAVSFKVSAYCGGITYSYGQVKIITLPANPY